MTEVFNHSVFSHRVIVCCLSLIHRICFIQCRRSFQNRETLSRSVLSLCSAGQLGKSFSFAAAKHDTFTSFKTSFLCFFLQETLQRPFSTSCCSSTSSILLFSFELFQMLSFINNSPFSWSRGMESQRRTVKELFPPSLVNFSCPLENSDLSFDSRKKKTTSREKQKLTSNTKHSYSPVT